MSDVELVVVIVLHTVFQKTVHKLADPSDWVALGQVIEVVRSFCEWVVKHVDDKIYSSALSHVLLSSPERDTLASEGISGLSLSDEEDHT